MVCVLPHSKLQLQNKTHIHTYIYAGTCASPRSRTNKRLRQALQASDSYRATPLEQIQESVSENDARLKIYSLLCPIGFFNDEEEEEENENCNRDRVCLTLTQNFGQFLVDEQWRRSVRSLQSEPIAPDAKCIEFNLNKADDLVQKVSNEQSDSCNFKREKDQASETIFLQKITTRFKDDELNSTRTIRK
jgi:hypothetical protein